MDSATSHSAPLADDTRAGPASRREKQLSIRSTRAHDLAKQKAAALGISMSEVVERALERMPPFDEALPEGLERNEYGFLVAKSQGRGPISNEEANALFERLRMDDDDA
jgi:hypothetical protein